jgi:hypothetical protein
MHNFVCKIKAELKRGCLSLDLNRLDNQKVDFVIKMLPLFKRFEITSSSLTSIPNLRTAIESSTSLRNIQFTNCTITNNDAETIASIYAKNRGLRSLTLTECTFAEAHRASLQNIVSPDTTRALFLERCKISAAPLFNFNLGLSQTTSLRRITLDFAMELATLATILLTNRSIKFFRSSEFTGSEDDVIAVKDSVIENDVILLIHPEITKEITRLMLYNRDFTCKSLQM